MERTKTYTQRQPNGGVQVDVEGMAVDLITVMKASGFTKEMFVKLLSETWDQVEVTIDTSAVKKDS